MKLEGFLQTDWAVAAAPIWMLLATGWCAWLTLDWFLPWLRMFRVQREDTIKGGAVMSMLTAFAVLSLLQLRASDSAIDGAGGFHNFLLTGLPLMLTAPVQLRSVFQGSFRLAHRRRRFVNDLRLLNTPHMTQAAAEPLIANELVHSLAHESSCEIFDLFGDVCPVCFPPTPPTAAAPAPAASAADSLQLQAPTPLQLSLDASHQVAGEQKQLALADDVKQEETQQLPQQPAPASATAIPPQTRTSVEIAIDLSLSLTSP